MKKGLRVLISALILALSLTADAVPPAYIGPMGNLEEPAMRPYKWLWFGIKKLWQRPLQAIGQGDCRVPLFGALELTRGAERGVIELGESVYHGLVFAPPPKCYNYSGAGAVNAFIESDWLLDKVADTVAVTPIVVNVLENVPLRSEADLQRAQARSVSCAIRDGYLGESVTIDLPCESGEPIPVETATAPLNPPVYICPPGVHILMPSENQACPMPEKPSRASKKN